MSHAIDSAGRHYDVRGNLRYRIADTGRGSAELGPCEVCNKPADEVSLRGTSFPRASDTRPACATLATGARMANNRRTIVAPLPEYEAWQRHAARLTGSLGRAVSVSEMVRNAVANAIREYAEHEQEARSDAGTARKSGRAGFTGGAGHMVFAAVAPSDSPSSTKSSVDVGEGARLEEVSPARPPRSPVTKEQQARKPKRGVA